MDLEMLKQWTPVDEELFRQMIRMVNEIRIGRKTNEDFDELVLTNKDKMNNPDYVQIFVEQAELLDEYYEKHQEICDIFFAVISKNNDWQELHFGVRQFIRMATFKEEYKNFKNHKQKVTYIHEYIEKRKE